MRTNKWLEFREGVADRERSRVQDAQKLWEENRKVAWSRTQTAYALEVATLSGAYVVMAKLAWVAFLFWFWGLCFWLGYFCSCDAICSRAILFESFCLRKTECLSSGGICLVLRQNGCS